MNNKKFRINFASVLVVLLCTANTAFAKPLITHPVKPLIIKAGIVLAGIIFFVIVVKICISLYNRFFVPNEFKNYKLSKNSLRGPSDKDEAIIMYLTKNKLK